MKTLNFRCASIEDAPRLTEIAFAAKRSWHYPVEWMELWRHDLVITSHYIEAEVIQVAELEGQIIGFAGLSSGDEGRHLEHLWLLPEYMGRGYGRKLFEEIVRMARKDGVMNLFINSDPNAEAFYLKMGAVRVGREIYELPGAILREVPRLLYELNRAP